MKTILFSHCREAEQKAIRTTDKPGQKLEGDSRQAEAAYTALLSVISDAGLEDEYRRYKSERRTQNVTDNDHVGKPSQKEAQPVGLVC